MQKPSWCLVVKQIYSIPAQDNYIWLETFDGGKNPAWNFDAGFGTAAAEVKAKAEEEEEIYDTSRMV